MIDHGPGIPVPDRERIFDEFFRLGAPTDGQGTGLGLAIVRALVLANQGAVRCEETPAGGATFVLELPIARRGGGTVSAVLLVEDDRMLRRALRASFRNWDFDVAEAGSGEEALSMVSDSPPDLVVLDLTLPGIDGLETLRHLRTFTDVPVVVLTVRDSLRDKISRVRVRRRRLRAQALRARGAARSLRGRTSAGRPGSTSPPPCAPATSRSTWPRAS